MSRPTVSAIAGTTAAVLGIPAIAMRSKSRVTIWVRARQISIYVAHERYGHSHSAAARILNRDRTTAIHAIRTIAYALERDPNLPIVVDAIVARIEGGATLIGAEPYIAAWRSRYFRQKKTPRDVKVAKLPPRELVVPVDPDPPPPTISIAPVRINLDEAAKLRKAGWSFKGLARRFKTEQHLIAAALGEPWNEMPAW